MTGNLNQNLHLRTSKIYDTNPIASNQQTHQKFKEVTVYYSSL